MSNYRVTKERKKLTFSGCFKKILDDLFKSEANVAPPSDANLSISIFTFFSSLSCRE